MNIVVAIRSAYCVTLHENYDVCFSTTSRKRIAMHPAIQLSLFAPNSLVYTEDKRMPKSGESCGGLEISFEKNLLPQHQTSLLHKTYVNIMCSYVQHHKKYTVVSQRT